MAMKNPYCDYDEYMFAPCNHSLQDSEDWASWALKASRMIDDLTNGRAAVHAAALSKELAYACAQIMDILHQNYQARLAAAGGLAGASNDGYSETYVAAGDASKATNRICLEILVEALGTDPYGLLYAGVI